MTAYQQGFVASCLRSGIPPNSVPELCKSAQLWSNLTSAANTAANLKVLSDMTNMALARQLDDESENHKSKPKASSRARMKMKIDRDLLRELTPEQRKRLFFAMKSMNTR